MLVDRRGVLTPLYRAPEAKLTTIAGSIRFHNVIAIETTAKEYTHITDLFMGDLARKQMWPLVG